LNALLIVLNGIFPKNGNSIANIRVYYKLYVTKHKIIDSKRSKDVQNLITFR